MQTGINIINVIQNQQLLLYFKVYQLLKWKKEAILFYKSSRMANRRFFFLFNKH